MGSSVGRHSQMIMRNFQKIRIICEARNSNPSQILSFPESPSECRNCSFLLGAVSNSCIDPDICYNSRFLKPRRRGPSQIDGNLHRMVKTVSGLQLLQPISIEKYFFFDLMVTTTVSED
ncbi:collagen alpha-1(XXI) chain [Striga asiatica]|uniref:Collagen alpha-1(XXI) chain n=1 Tax=Striga asiatica TaxID=4170 RepID=A0A5A7PT98_STRAF|nr:collagen alpha-1(XXI) chain [Striga asiatica]